jgi:BMFP domain-containing protein YqiC
LWNEVDEELVSAYAAMQASIQELDEAVGFESYSSIKTVQDDVLVNSAKLDEIDKKLQSYRENVGKDIQQVYASTLNLQVVVSEGFSAIQYQLSENHVEQNALLRQILKNTAKLSRAPENEEKKKQEVKSKGDVGDRKFKPCGN